jgi:hypothetical protein
MIDRLAPLAKRICESAKKISQNAAALRSSDITLKESTEEKLILPVSPTPLDISVCAVDGGLLADRLFGADILVRKSVATHFTYKDSQLMNVEHFPRKFPESEIDFRTGLDEHEAMQFRSLFRLHGEIKAAREAIEKFKPDFLLMDGSIVLLGADRPNERSPLFDEYKSLINCYKALYEQCMVSGVQLVGVIKDSRGKRLVECLQDQMLVDVPDTTLTDSLLKERERTCMLPYSDDTKKHPVLRDLGEQAARINLFYLKPSVMDSPLRIEFLQSKKSTDEIASVIHTLSSISKTFAYPAALIEADMCAALQPIEMDKIKRSLFVLTGGASKPLRRQNRPFR